MFRVWANGQRQDIHDGRRVEGRRGGRLVRRVCVCSGRRVQPQQGVCVRVHVCVRAWMCVFGCVFELVCMRASMRACACVGQKGGDVWLDLATVLPHISEAYRIPTSWPAPWLWPNASPISTFAHLHICTWPTYQLLGVFLRSRFQLVLTFPIPAPSSFCRSRSMPPRGCASA